MAVIVSVAYFYSRSQYRPQSIPGKMGLEIQQTANGFTISKSEQGRTVFTIRASNAVQYRQGGQAVLRDVAITVYGKQSDRFDQIYGSEFLYDQQTGVVTAKGEVQIDLQANPAGSLQPDQAPPKELKNPLHLKTIGLVFDQKTGNAYTRERVDFALPQAVGSCVGASYASREGLLQMQSKVHVVVAGEVPATLDAASGVIQREPRQVDLANPHLVRGPETYQSDHATVYLHPDNSIDRMVGTGHVAIHMEGDSPVDARSDRADLFMVPANAPAGDKSVPATTSAPRPQVSKVAVASSKSPAPAQSPLSVSASRTVLRTAILSGTVHVENRGEQRMEADAGRATFHFSGDNVLTTARAEGEVRITQHHLSGSQASQPATVQGAAKQRQSSAQDVVVNAPVIDFVIGNAGKSLQSAVTSGPPKISILPSDGKPGEQTVITARKFLAKFDDESRLKSVHGAPEAKIVNSAPNEADRVSTSKVLDVAFLPAGGIQSVLQTGDVAYVDGERKAWGDRARYTPDDQMLSLAGSPRFVQGGMTTTARAMRMDRAKGDAYAEGNVKSTYSDLKAQPNGALLASSDPIHVTAISMVSHRDPGVATYTGNARLWQNTSVVQAPIIQFDRDTRNVVAEGTPDYRVSTLFIQADNKDNQTPVHIISDHLTYSDPERTAHFTGKVVAKSADATLNSDESQVYLLPQSGGQPGSADKRTEQRAGGNKIDKIVADGHVVVVQPSRRAQGTHLVHTASDDRFVLTGGPPSIFDAERGKVTGVSLTFYKRDDRVLVEGGENSPAFTQARVAR